MNEVIKITPEEEVILVKYLTSFFAKEIKVNYMLFKNSDVSISVYQTGKVLFQGKESNSWYIKVNNLLNRCDCFKNEANVDELTSQQGKRRIGIDESGKGDFFGPLVTVAYFIEDTNQETELLKIGVKDSKELTDRRIEEISPYIKQIGKYETVIIGPKKYNELYSKIQNLNNILAWSHARCIENILNRESIETAISDQFGEKHYIEQALLEKGRTINLIQTHKAERDLAVAAASILARDTFIKQLRYLSEKSGYNLKKGASQEVLQIGKKIVNEKGKEYLVNIAKIHFKTYEKMI